MDGFIHNVFIAETMIQGGTVLLDSGHSVVDFRNEGKFDRFLPKIQLTNPSNSNGEKLSPQSGALTFHECFILPSFFVKDPLVHIICKTDQVFICLHLGTNFLVVTFHIVLVGIDLFASLFPLLFSIVYYLYYSR